MKKLGLDKVMWGSDYPHHEGSTPFSRELLRRAFSRLDRRTSSTRCSRARPPTSTASTSRELADQAAEVGPTVAELQEPLEQQPEGRDQPRLLPMRSPTAQGSGSLGTSKCSW